MYIFFRQTNILKSFVTKPLNNNNVKFIGRNQCKKNLFY